MSELPGDKEVLITPEGQVLDLSVTGTMKIDSGKHSPITNQNRLKSLKFAVAGLLYVLVKEQSIKFASGLTVVVVGVGLWLGMTETHWALLTLALGNIWVTECLNTAIEASINLGTSEPHPMAKVGKDVASAAALISSLVFVVIVLLIVGPRVWAKVGR